MKVVKIGGSLLHRVKKIMPMFKEYEVLLIPGGGIFADTVRKVYLDQDISEDTAHAMALLAVDQYGHLLSEASGIPAVQSLQALKGQGVLLPSKIISESSLPPSWDVASDTIACYIARSIGEKGFIKLTCVDGINLDRQVVKSIDAGKLLNINTCVDKSLPLYLQTWKMNCRIVNGEIESNIRRVLEGETIGTLITGGMNKWKN